MDPDFEFDVPKYCDLEEVQDENAVQAAAHDEFFDRVHALHEPRTRHAPKPLLSKDEISDALLSCGANNTDSQNHNVDAMSTPKKALFSPSLRKQPRTPLQDSTNSNCAGPHGTPGLMSPKTPKTLSTAATNGRASPFFSPSGIRGTPSIPKTPTSRSLLLSPELRKPLTFPAPIQDSDNNNNNDDEDDGDEDVKKSTKDERERPRLLKAKFSHLFQRRLQQQPADATAASGLGAGLRLGAGCADADSFDAECEMDDLDRRQDAEPEDESENGKLGNGSSGGLFRDARGTTRTMLGPPKSVGPRRTVLDEIDPSKRKTVGLAFTMMSHKRMRTELTHSKSHPVEHQPQEGRVDADDDDDDDDVDEEEEEDEPAHKKRRVDSSAASSRHNVWNGVGDDADEHAKEKDHDDAEEDEDEEEGGERTDGAKVSYVSGVPIPIPMPTNLPSSCNNPHGSRFIRKWEKDTGKKWTALSPRTRISVRNQPPLL
eukprot:ANDGO_05102.mRNA.1 hypothetical protein